MKKLDSSWHVVKKDYKLLEVLGEGVYGQVVKAVHRESKKVVAIKNVSCSFNDLTHIKYVLREITILRQFSLIKNNKSTSKLYDIMISDTALDNFLELKNIFLIMENGHNDLQALLKEPREEKNPELLITIIYNILKSMNFVHSHGIMHRDIKPANLLISAKNDIKICDFGLSRATLKDNDLTKSSLTKESAIKYINIED